MDVFIINISISVCNAYKKYVSFSRLAVFNQETLELISECLLDSPPLCGWTMERGRFALADRSGSISIFGATTDKPKLLHVLSGIGGAFRGLKGFTNQRHAAVISANNGTVYLLDIKKLRNSEAALSTTPITYNESRYKTLLNQTLLSSLSEYEPAPISVRKDGLHIAVGGQDGTYIVKTTSKRKKNKQSLSVEKPVMIGKESVSCVCYGGETNCLLAIATENCGIDIFSAGAYDNDTINYELLYTIQDIKTGIECLKFGCDTLIATTDTNELTFRKITQTEAKEIKTIQFHKETMPCIGISPSGHVAATTSEKGVIALYSTISGRILRNICGVSCGVIDAAIDPQKTILAASVIFHSSHTYAILLYDFIGGVLLDAIHGFVNPIISIAFGVDGTFFCSTLETLYVYHLSRDLGTSFDNSVQLKVVFEKEVSENEQEEANTINSNLGNEDNQSILVADEKNEIQEGIITRSCFCTCRFISWMQRFYYIIHNKRRYNGRQQ